MLFAITVYFELPYQCAKDTKRAIPSIILTAVVNITLNFVLTPLLHIYGVILTAIISYLTLIIYRWIDTRRYFTLHFYKRTMIPLVLIGFGVIPFYLNHNHYIDALFIVASSIVLFYSSSPKMRDEIFWKKKKSNPITQDHLRTFLGG